MHHFFLSNSLIIEITSAASMGVSSLVNSNNFFDVNHVGASGAKNMSLNETFYRVS